jgi:hypothetical protein
MNLEFILKLIFGLTCSCFWIASQSFALDSSMQTFDDADSDQVLELDDQWVPEDSLDLTSSQGERRLEHSHFAGIGLGEFVPWNTAAIKWGKVMDEQVAFDLGVGYGKSSNLVGSQSMRVKIDSKHIYGNVQWWPSDKFPFALFGVMGAHQWASQSTCTVGESTYSCQDGKLGATGFSSAFGLKISWFSENSFVMDWTILGTRNAFLLSKKVDDQLSDSVADEMRKLIVAQKFMNFVNFSLAYRY